MFCLLDFPQGIIYNFNYLFQERKLHMKIALGIIIIVLSFAYILRHPGKSMMDTLMEDKQKKFEQALAEAEAQRERNAAAAPEESDETTRS